MATETKERSGPMDRLKNEAGGLIDALTERATASVRERVQGATGRLTDYVEGDGGPGLIAAVTGAKGLAEGKSPLRSMFGAGFAGVKEKVAGMFRRGGKGGGGKRKLKLTNIVESVDVGVPVRLAYNQWTQFADFPTFMKKVETVQQADEQKLNWKAQVWWSHRTWEATILEQRPDEYIVWRSKAPKGHVDGAVTFHELAPNLTRVLLVLEYHPQGMFERTGNLWRAQGRRARLELKHYQRHVMAHALLKPDEVEGWRGVIEEGEVVKDHETALREEGREPGELEAEPGELTGEERDDRDRPGDEDDGYDVRADEPGDDEAEAGEPDEGRRAGNGGRSAGRRRTAASAEGTGRRPATARRGAAQGDAR